MENINEQIQYLIQLLKEKLIYVNDILKLSDKQTEIIQNEQMDKLENLINAKQSRIDKISKIDQKFSKSFSSIKKQYNITELGELDIKKELIHEIKKITEEVYIVLSKIHEVENLNKKLMNKNFKEVKARLKNVKKGRKATSKYYKKAAQTGGYFIDNKK